MNSRTKKIINCKTYFQHYIDLILKVQFLRNFEHETIQRTLSEDPTRDLYCVEHPLFSEKQHAINIDIHSRTSSRQSAQSSFTQEASQTTNSEMYSTDARNDSRLSHISSKSDVLSRISHETANSFEPRESLPTEKWILEYNDKKSNNFVHDTHSLPRRCIHHWDGHRMFLASDGYESLPRRASYAPNKFEPKYNEKRRASFSERSNQLQQFCPNKELIFTPCFKNRSESSDDEDHDDNTMINSSEKEILIDFKPQPSPLKNKSRKKHLIKTKSDGDILVEKKVEKETLNHIATSEKDVTATFSSTEKQFAYSGLPIKDEGRCKEIQKEFRRSASFETSNESLAFNTTPPDEIINSLPEFPSNDSLRETSEMWSESQVTVLT